MNRWIWAVCLVGLLSTTEAHAAILDPATATFQWDQLGVGASVSSCVTSAATWQNVPVTPQGADFTVEFDATPLAAGIDGVVGLSNGPAVDYNSLAAVMLFHPNNTITALNGTVYTATNSIPYTMGTSYHFRFVVSLSAHTYSVYVISGTAAEQLLASNFAFRPVQAGAISLNNLGGYASIGSEQFCVLTPSPVPDAVTGWNLKCGPTSGTYTVSYSVALPYAPVPIKNVVAAPGTYFCIVTGVNLAGESLPSNEVTFQIAAGAHPPAAPVLKMCPNALKC